MKAMQVSLTHFREQVTRLQAQCEHLKGDFSAMHTDYFKKRKRDESLRSRSGPVPNGHGKPGEEVASEGTYRIEDNTVATLCRIMLTDAEARHYVKEHGSLELLKNVSDTEMLALIWASDSLDANNPGSVASFISTLPRPQQSCASSILARDEPSPGTAGARDCLIQLMTKSVKNQIQERTSILKRSDLTDEEVMKHQKEVLDLKSRLTDIARSFPVEPQ